MKMSGQEVLVGNGVEPVVVARETGFYKGMVGSKEIICSERLSESISTSASASVSPGRRSGLARGVSSPILGRGKGRIVSAMKRKGMKKSAAVKDEKIPTEGRVQVEALEPEQDLEREDATAKAKGKERDMSEHGVGNSGASASARPPVITANSTQQFPSHRSHAAHPHPHPQGYPHLQLHQAHHLRQLPTNPPRRHQSPAHRPVPAAASNAEASQKQGNSRGDDKPSTKSPTSNTESKGSATRSSRSHKHGPAPSAMNSGTRHLPYHPQLSHLGLGHLPTVPPKQRRPIEIMETSSEYETTDTEAGDDSSWESTESIGKVGGDEGAGDGAKEVREGAGTDPLKQRPMGDGPKGTSRHRHGEEVVAGPSKYVGEGANGPLKHCNTGEETSEKETANTNGTATEMVGATTSNNHRTRDAGEFARDAALEAQRQRELFQKLPEQSYVNQAHLTRARSGLSLLFRPDPGLFPEGHPYRASGSRRDILARNWTAPGPPLAMMAVKRAAAVAPVQASVHADVVVSSVNSKGSATGSQERSQDADGAMQRGGYRPRVKPADQEEETDSGEDDPEDVIQVSSSVAERRLAAIMGLRAGFQESSRVSLHAQEASNLNLATTAQDPPALPPLVRMSTAPVLVRPLYLPDPAPLQTPHTVRRHIIASELPEDLRKNLLWERSQCQILGRPARAPGSILPGPWRPLLRSEGGEIEPQLSPSDMAPGKRPFGTQRTKSWAGDFHASGW